MASFICGFSLFIFVLINGCFTLPIGEIQFPDFTASPFYDDLTTENSFNTRAINDTEIFTTPFNDIKRSENEEIFSHTETNPTVSTDLKRSLSESDNFDMTTAAVQFESVSDASRQERISEEPFTFTETTERSSEEKRTVEEPFTFTETTERSSEEKRTVEEPFTFTETTERSSEEKRAVEEPSTFTDVPTTESLDIVPHEHETHHNKRGSVDAEEKSIDTEIHSKFTTSHMPLFTSTSSAVAPELYTREPIEFSSIQTSTRKYVGSLVDPEEDNEERKPHHEDDIEGSKQDSKKPEKEEKIEDEEHKEDEHKEDEEHKEEGEHKEDEVHKEEEEEHNEKVVDSDKKTDRENKRPTSDKEVSVDSSNGEKYLVGELFDQDSSKYRPTLPSNFAILDESVVPVTAELVRPSKTKKVSNEDNKLNQGSTLLLFLLAAFLFCACLTASTLAFVKNRHKLNRKSRIIEMEAHLDEHYLHPFLFHQHHEK